MLKYKFIKNFQEINKDDLPSVGGKGANLGELTGCGLPVPPGFVLTAQAYFYFLKVNQLKEKIAQILKLADKNDPNSFQRVSRAVQKLILAAPVPKTIAKEVFIAYEQLVGLFNKTPVAVRSSATAEDLPGASFAGQQASYLNVVGEATLLQKMKHCWASLFTPRAIFYRQEKGFNHLKTGLAVIVQKMIEAEVSGVMFTADPLNQQKRLLVIEAIWGLGEFLVQGTVTPDHYEVDRLTLKIKKKVIAKQSIKLAKKAQQTLEVKVPAKEQEKQKLPDKLILELSRLGKKVHQHYFFPQDIEWAVSRGKIYLLQARPITTLVNPKIPPKEVVPKTQLKLLVKGDPASPGIGTGYARIISSVKEIGKLKRGEVLVTEMTTPDFVPAMKKVAAIVTDRGGQTSHAAIVSRELGLPCVVGTNKGTKVLKTGQVVTVNGKTGEVFAGGFLNAQAGFANNFSYSLPKTGSFQTRTKLYVNLAEPELAEKVAAEDVDGVGLLRAEFMIAAIGTHPRKLIDEGQSQVFIDRLTEGLTKFCKAFYPRPVVYRTTDFKTSEYANLKGGKAYEPKEANPLLGYRGAFRYVADEQVFALELKAIKFVRHKLKLDNLWLMIPFVRTVKELSKVKQIIKKHGLERNHNFKLWMMVEIPSNVILLDDFLAVGIDGVSIGSNDLTMLILGLDRDNETVAAEFDERNEAVLWALEKVIKGCQKHRVSSSICGQAPSQYPDLVKKLINWGITSISVNPDVLSYGRKMIYEAEKNLFK